MPEEKKVEPAQFFVSHTKLDSDFCDKFDIAASREGVKIFRSELEKIDNPACKTIKDAINKSCALFLLVGKQLVEMQAKSEIDLTFKEKWKFTQNWIAFEIGVACQLGIDVWVYCDNVNINFPVPYLNNYEIWGIPQVDRASLEFLRSVFRDYTRGIDTPIHGTYVHGPDRTHECPHCGATFNLHSILPKGIEIPCPTCLATLKFPNGWLLMVEK
jgi:hypothetical protein